MNLSEERVYYVYAWYYVDTGEIFYIGKGKNKRYQERKAHRNQFFINILNKYGTGVDVKILESGMAEKDALDRERQLIAEYWKRGQCKANIHEGGCGGNTGKYDDPERSRKLREHAKRMVGPLNPMYGKTHTDEVKEFLSRINKGRRISERCRQALIRASTGRIKSPEERRKLSMAQKGRKHSKEQTLHNNLAQSDKIYEVVYGGSLLYRCVGMNALNRFCKKNLRISRTIIPLIIGKNYVPKFNRHKWIERLSIPVKTKDVYTNWKNIFRDSVEEITDQQGLNELVEYIKQLDKQARINRYRRIPPSKIYTDSI